MLSNIKIFILLCLSTFFMSGCEKLLQPDAEKNKSSRSRLMEKTPKIKIIKVLKADLLQILINGNTQNVHLAGIKAPSPKPGRFNNDLSKSLGQDINLINKAGKQGITLTKELTKGRELRFVNFGTNTVKNGKVIFDGDIIFQNDTTLIEKLLNYGAAIAPYDKYSAVTAYKQIEDDAKKNERGLWKHPVEIDRRFYARSSFKSETLGMNRSQVRQQGNGNNQRLESHKEFEKQGKIIIDLRVRKPLFHPYKGTITYAFVKRQDYGKKVQEISSAPLRGETRSSRRSSSSRSNYKPLSSADREKNRRNKQKDSDYNKGVSGKNVFKIASSKSITEEFEFNSLSTNIVVLSDIVNYTKSTKAGTSYSHGEYYVNYDLEIRIGTNLIYSHYHNQ